MLKSYRTRQPAPTPVVYTMGKVASTSVTTALEAAGLHSHQIHHLDKKILIALAKPFIENSDLPKRHISQAMAYRRDYLSRRENFIFISLVRDPIARNLSAFFENLDAKPEKISEEPDADVLFAHFMKDYPHAIPLTWFDREFGDQLGIDVFSTPFDTGRKYLYLKNRKTLLMRADCPDDLKSRILSDVFDRKIKVGQKNDGADKDYADRYAGVKKRTRFSAEFVNQIYDSKFCRHFWTTAEIGQMKRRWTS